MSLNPVDNSAAANLRDAENRLWNYRNQAEYYKNHSVADRKRVVDRLVAAECKIDPGTNAETFRKLLDGYFGISN